MAFDTDTLTLLHNCYLDYQYKNAKYDKMHDYYKGDTDAMENYKLITERSNNKTKCNFVKKFIDEEVSYTLGNEIAYLSNSGNKNIIEVLTYSLAHWSTAHDSKLGTKLYKYGIAYELYYIEEDLQGNNQFSCKIISPRHGYAYLDEKNRVTYFLHIYQKKFNAQTFIDIYTPQFIHHCNSSFEEIALPTINIFGIVPVGIAKIDGTIYDAIKGLQDAYETNLSDISNEISDFRNAYLTFAGCELEKEDITKMKELGVINLPGEKSVASWLIKNINDSFIQNTLTTLEDKMYQLTAHINHNEAMQSNLSGVALRSRLISLEEKCKLNQKAVADCIITRLQMLFLWLKIEKGEVYDFRDIKLKFTPNIPQDDLTTAQMISAVGTDFFPKETVYSLFSFITNPQNEVKKIDEEQKVNSIGADLLGTTNDSGNGGVVNE